MPGPFSLHVERRGSKANVIVRGELDVANTPQLCEAIETALADGALEVLIDCRAMTFLDSSGVGALLDLRKQLASRGGVLILFAPTEAVAQTLEVTGLDAEFHVVPLPDE
jgi:anti-sigma B factor antagonist